MHSKNYRDTINILGFSKLVYFSGYSANRIFVQDNNFGKEKKQEKITFKAIQKTLKIKTEKIDEEVKLMELFTKDDFRK